MNESENNKGNEKERDDRTRTLDKMCKFFFPLDPLGSVRTHTKAVI